MIGFLRGNVLFRDDPYIYIDVQGVGYKVLATREVITASANSEKTLLVYTYTHVREDILELFGFLHAEDLKLFEKLIAVPGVGPKTAVQIFSTGSRRDIVEAIISGNISFFTSVPRLGKKNAQKIILELKSKFTTGGDELALLDETSIQHDVVTALQSMGFSTAEIQAALRSVPEGFSVDETLKHALKSLGR